MSLQLQMLSPLQLHFVRVAEAFDELQRFVQHGHFLVGGGLSKSSIFVAGFSGLSRKV
jgi:hypothetical protein